MKHGSPAEEDLPASYKRMLAYSSVEHVGLMCLGFGPGGGGAFAALLPMLGHAADERGKLYRVKVQDPSFVNRRPLSFALIKNIVPDFPLCSKSFNLSYSGNDL